MTPGHSRCFLLFLFLLAAISGARAGDLKVVSVFRSENGDTHTTARYYKGERLRIEWRNHTSWKPGLVTYGPPVATIYQCDAQRAVELNLESHKYAITQLNDACQGKDATPPPPLKGTIDVYIESNDTGERRQILGRTARRIITHQRQVARPQSCGHDAEMERDGWYIEMNEQEIDQKLRGHSAGGSANVMFSGGANCRDKIDVHRKGVEKPGVALKLVQTWRFSAPLPDGTSKEFTRRWEIEVTELSETPLDAALFDIPAGFTKVAEIDAQPNMPASIALAYWWNRTRNTVSSWF